MSRYWWVNHNQTFAQEISGRYLWSPKEEANGARSQFYDNMRLVSPGDLILSFAGGEIAYIGVVREFALSAPKPTEFGSTGTNWSNEGWLLPVKWTRLATPVRPKDLISRLRPHLPEKYSPIQPQTGKGNQKAYLSEINRGVLDLIVAPQILSAALEINASADMEAAYTAIVEQLDDAVEQNIASDESIVSSERMQIIKARRGQGEFRRRVADVESGCRVTGITNQGFLIASHIKPWRACHTSRERLDGFNGLLWAPHVDFLFDRGFISFRDDGAVLISPHLGPEDLDKMGLKQATARLTGPFRPEQRAYLEYHRSDVYLWNARPDNLGKPRASDAGS